MQQLTPLGYSVLGATYAFAAAVQPGQFQAYIISQALTAGWRRTLPAALAPVLSDIPVVSVVLLVLTRVPPLFTSVLQLVGGFFVLYLSAHALRTFRRGEAGPALPDEAHRTVLKAASVNLLNPNPYLAWALILGPLLLRAWREAPGHGIAFVVAFYATMVIMTAAIILFFAAARALGSRVAHVLLGASAVALGCFGLFQIWSGLTALVAR